MKLTMFHVYAETQEDSSTLRVDQEVVRLTRLEAALDEVYDRRARGQTVGLNAWVGQRKVKLLDVNEAQIPREALTELLRAQRGES